MQTISIQTKPVIKGVYAITPDEENTAILIAMAEAALQGGIDVLQYRNKRANHKLQTQQARLLLPLCRQYRTPLIINDSIKLCLTLDADGVHLGADDGNLADARARLGPDKILGASCYNRLDLALAAAEAGADYAAFGACFASGTKPNAPVAPLSLFAQAKAMIKIPLVAIGGIDLQNAPLVVQAGADAVAVVGALFNVNNHTQQISHAAHDFSLLFAS
jgi:thiamine-phosphate pyrophosphorylase